jgi:3-hydroxymyristoyl/3-hydroxydecanoyl-(acyl carrier protein) dehydratase
MPLAIHDDSVGAESLALDSQLLRLIMPHRHAMMLLDGVSECAFTEQRLTGYKNVGANDPAVQGHFPDWPFFPPALLIEAMAQAAGCLMNLLYVLDHGITLDNLRDPSSLAGKLAKAPLPGLSVLAESRVRQFDVAFPGDTIVLEARILSRRGELTAFAVQANVQERQIAAGEMILGYPPYVPSFHEIARIKDKV